MPRPVITWLLADTHLYHDVMVTEAGWPKDYYNRLFKQCKHLIAPQDTLIHLGDVIFYRYQMLPNFLDEIPCRKILTKSNHDHKSDHWYMTHGFDFVVDSFIRGNVMFSHYPQPVFPVGVTRNVHGHWHENDHAGEAGYEYYDSKKHFKFSPEETQFAPVPLLNFLAAQTARGEHE